jgi:PD-(D/E)XK endonuclease
MILATLASSGYRILVPFGEGHPYDLVIDTGGSAFVRVQCKTAWPVGGCLVFNCRSTDHGRGPSRIEGGPTSLGSTFRLVTRPT